MHGRICSQHRFPFITGVKEVVINMEEQKVTVKITDETTPEAVLEKVVKTGKKTELWA